MGFILQNFGFSHVLLTTAEAYLALGYSVIPLYGDADPERAKIAAISWKPYQYKRPTVGDLHQWFVVDNFGALGIVTGRISNLVVLDFDDPDLFQTFSHQHPDLAEWHVIQTRRGYHIYYQLPPHLTLASRKGQGIDLLSDGRYVVARPSTISGYTYRLIRGGQPRRLNQHDIDRITRFMGIQATSVAMPATQREFAPFSQDCRGVAANHSHPQTPVLTVQELLWTYTASAHLGRNNALFRASLRARDAGWAEAETLSCLLQAHVQQPTAHPHIPESRQRRAQEAIRTVHSAFSRPARPQTRQHHNSQQLPNTVREALFRQRRTDVVRVLEGLLLKGAQPGQPFTAEEAVSLLRGVVGRDSIYHALNAQTEKGTIIFEQLSPSALPIAPNGAATDTDPTQNKKMLFVRGKNPGISPSHRPKRVFVMPSNLELCAKLGVKPSHSDPLTLDDLATAKKTRMAVHRELIKRRPGIYPRRWLARRVGVCPKTIDTYNWDIPIHSRHLYLEIRVFWSNLSDVPDTGPIDGAFLEDETRKRYPPKRQIAAILLSKGHSVTYKRQDANYYWYGNTPPNLSVLLGFHPNQPTLDVRIAAIQAYTAAATPMRRPTLPPSSRSAIHTEKLQPSLPSDHHTAISQSTRSVTPTKPKPRKHHYQKPLADPNAEMFAQQVYAQLTERAGQGKGEVSRATARRLVDTYGIEHVKKGLSVIVSRSNILNPTAFLVTWLRSEKPIR